MSDKRMIDVDELKEMICEHMVGRLWIGTSAIMAIIDSLAQPIEPVKTEAIEACIRAYVGDLAKVAEAELEAIKKGNARCKVEHGMHINLAHCQK